MSESEIEADELGIHLRGPISSLTLAQLAESVRGILVLFPCYYSKGFQVDESVLSDIRESSELDDLSEELPSLSVPFWHRRTHTRGGSSTDTNESSVAPARPRLTPCPYVFPLCSLLHT